MKKVLLIIAILLIVAGVLSLFASGFCWNLYKGALDASAEFYHTQYDRALAFLGAGIASLSLGILLLFLRSRVIV